MCQERATHYAFDLVQATGWRLRRRFRRLALVNYARALDCTGRSAEAEWLAGSVLTMSITIFGENHQRIATARMRIAEVYLHTGRAKEAEPLLRSAIATFHGLGELHWGVGDALARL